MATAHLAMVDASTGTFTLRSDETIDFFIESSADIAGAWNIESALVASLLYMMKQSVNVVRVEGALSPTLLTNIEELQRCWSKWRPEIYTPVEIVPEGLRDDKAAGAGAIAAFSGGVDGAFTLLRNTSSEVHESLRVRDVVMVHGFDIGLHEGDTFRRAMMRCRRMTDVFGVPIHVVRTDIKLKLAAPWEDAFGLAMSAVLLMFQTQRRFGLIGSSYAYDELYLPWGSSPVQDWMTTTGGMQIRHDGAGFSRLEKIAQLVEVPELVDNLRVCWSGALHDRNCGKCEKCVRTMLDLAIVGQCAPKAFPGRLDARLVRSIRPAAHIVGSYRSAVHAAITSGRTDSWVLAAAYVVKRAQLRRAMRTWARRILDMLSTRSIVWLALQGVLARRRRDVHGCMPARPQWGRRSREGRLSTTTGDSRPNRRDSHRRHREQSV